MIKIGDGAVFRDEFDAYWVYRHYQKQKLRGQVEGSKKRLAMINVNWPIVWAEMNKSKGTSFFWGDKPNGR